MSGDAEGLAPPDKPAGHPPPRIAIFLHDLRGGGAERVMLKLAGGLIARGFHVDLVLVQQAGDLIRQIPSGARVINLAASRTWAGIPGLRRYLRADRPDWLISALTHVNLVAILARALSGSATRLLVTEHSQISHKAQTTRTMSAWITYRMVRWLYRLPDRIVAVSDGAAKDLIDFTGLPPARVQRIYNPVFDEALLAAASAGTEHPWLRGDHRVILAAGRLEPIKGFGCLLHAFARLRQTEDAKLIILGEGSKRPSLEALMTRLDLHEDVDLPGFVTNPYAFMSRAQVFVLSSRAEGLSLVLIEALACGAAVVATDCPSGPREILEGGRFGTLVPVDDVEALATAMASALHGMRGQHRARAAEFDTPSALEAYAALLGMEPHNGHA